MDTQRPCDSLEALYEIARLELEPWGFEVEPAHIDVSPYVFDDRNGWDTYIVTVEGYGVLGYTDGPVPQTEEPTK